MTTRFRRLAEEITVPAPALPPGFFDLARRARRRRHALTACVAVLLIALAGLGLLATAGPPAPPVGPDPYPARFPLPGQANLPAKMADVRSAPIARALLVTDLVDKLVLVGPDNSFRELRHDGVAHRFWLSPDGTRLAMLVSEHSYLLDIPTGEQQDLPGKPLTWSSDGTELAVSDGEGFDVLEVATMIVRWSVTGPRFDGCQDMQGVFSPDASRFATICARNLDIYQRSGHPAHHILPGSYGFAGDRAWSPLTQDIMLRPGESDHVYHVDVMSGVVSTEDPFQRWRPMGVAIPARIVDWWQGNPVFSSEAKFVTVADRPQPVQVLVVSWGQTAQAATAIVDWSRAGPPAEPDPGPIPLMSRVDQLWDSQTRFIAFALAVVLLLVIAAVIVNRVRGRAGRP